MKKIISILIFALMVFVFAQPALAGPVESCKSCIKDISDTITTDICGSVSGSKVAVDACNRRCTKTNLKGDDTTDADITQCKACCSVLGYSYGSPITNYQQISTLISTITRWFQGIVMAIAIIMIIYGGVLYITAAGSEDKAKTARKLLLYACIGIAIVLLAWGAEFLILSFLTP